MCFGYRALHTKILCLSVHRNVKVCYKCNCDSFDIVKMHCEFICGIIGNCSSAKTQHCIFSQPTVLRMNKTIRSFLWSILLTWQSSRIVFQLTAVVLYPNTCGRYVCLQKLFAFDVWATSIFSFPSCWRF